MSHDAFSDTMITLSAIAPFAQGPSTIRGSPPACGDRPPPRRRNELNRLGISHTNNPLIYTHNPGRYGLALYRRTATTGWRWHLR